MLGSFYLCIRLFHQLKLYFMSLITCDTQRAWEIPDDKGDEYFALVDLVSKYNPNTFMLHSADSAWNAYHQPIVIVDLAYFNKYWANLIISRFEKMGAKEVTENLQ